MDYDLIITLVWIVALVVWTFMFMRYKIFKANKRAELVTTMIEKNPNVDIEEQLKKVAPRQRLLKEKQLTKLLLGNIIFFIGISLFGVNLFGDWRGGCNPEQLSFFYLVSFILLGIGIAFYINYFVGKKMLAKEIEAEEKKMIAEAESK